MHPSLIPIEGGLELVREQKETCQWSVEAQQAMLQTIPAARET